MPTNTDLVTDLPADFEVFGQAVDTSMADLKGGTTGQILSKTTNADMDFTWIANDQGDITGVTATSPLTGGGTSGAITIGIQDATTSVKGSVQLSDSTSTTSSILAATPTAVKAAYDKASTAATTSVAGIVQLSDSTSTTSSVLASTPTATKSAYDLAAAAIAKTTVTTAGDIIYRNATVPTRLGIGTAGQVLTVNSGATAPEWTTATGAAFVKITSGSFSGVSSVSLPTNTFTSTYTNYKVILIIASSSGSTTITGRYRASGTDNSGTIYNSALSIARVTTTVAVTGVNGGTSFTMGYQSNNNNGPFGQSWDFLSPQAAAEKQIVGTGFGYNSELDTYSANWFGGHGNSSLQFDSFSWISGTGTITGSYYVYGYQN
jgi:hypothetical protein